MEIKPAEFTAGLNVGRRERGELRMTIRFWWELLAGPTLLNGERRGQASENRMPVRHPLRDAEQESDAACAAEGHT